MLDNLHILFLGSSESWCDSVGKSGYLMSWSKDLSYGCAMEENLGVIKGYGQKMW